MGFFGGALAATSGSNVPTSYERACLVPLPSNTTLDKQVQVDPCTVDFYYSQAQLPGASQGNRKWVCRRAVTDPNNGCTPDPSQYLQDPVENIDPAQFDPSTVGSSLCDGATGIFSWICGTGSGFSTSTWLIVGVVALIVVVLILTFLLPGSAVELARAA